MSPHQGAVDRSHYTGQHLSSIQPTFFKGEVVEKVIVQQQQQALNKVNYLDPFHPTFRFGHGTETPLVMILVDLWQEQVWGNASILAFLDFLVAFNHGILLDQHHGLGVGGAQYWAGSLSSYRTDIGWC